MLLLLPSRFHPSHPFLFLPTLPPFFSSQLLGLLLQEVLADSLFVLSSPVVSEPQYTVTVDISSIRLGAEITVLISKEPSIGRYSENVTSRKEEGGRAGRGEHGLVLA